MTMAMTTYTYGDDARGCDPCGTQRTVPWRLPMDLVGEDRDLVIRLVNIGIDSRLEAICNANEKFKARHRKVGGRTVTVSPASRLNTEDMLVLLRRLYEDGSEQAMMLRMSILQTLDIEEI